MIRITGLCLLDVETKDQKGLVTYSKSPSEGIPWQSSAGPELHASCRGHGFSPGWELKFLQAVWCGQNKRHCQAIEEQVNNKVEILLPRKYVLYVFL